jgi:hypothetical protein
MGETPVGGSQSLQNAIALLNQLNIFLPGALQLGGAAVAGAIALGHTLVDAINSNKGATTAEAQAAIAGFREALKDAGNYFDEWLASHPKV